MSVVKKVRILKCDAADCEATVELRPGYAAFDRGWVILKTPHSRHLCPEHSKGVSAAVGRVSDAIRALGKATGVDCYYINVKRGLLEDFGVISRE